jgi:DNA-binding SARP family transcriptional activator
VGGRAANDLFGPCKGDGVPITLAAKSMTPRREGLGMDGARLQLLDGFALERGAERVDVPVGVQHLVAFVALTGPAHRCLVAGTLWRDVPEAQALASLRTGIWRTNRLVPDLVRVDGPRLSLAISTTVDSRQQESVATRLLGHPSTDEPWIQEAAQLLWRGELLPGWYDDWVVFERERLGQLRLHALERLAMLLTRRGELDTALRLALEAVRTEPLRETANAALMGVYVAEGNLSDAVRQYDRFADLLRRELGVDPSPSLAAQLPVPVRR